MSGIDLDEIERLAQAATPGPVLALIAALRKAHTERDAARAKVETALHALDAIETIADGARIQGGNKLTWAEVHALAKQARDAIEGPRPRVDRIAKARAEGAAEALESEADHLARVADAQRPRGGESLAIAQGLWIAADHCRTKAAALREGSKKP